MKTNLSEDRAEILLETEPNELLNDSLNIFKKLNVDQYIDRPNALFNGGKYNALEDFSYAEFSAYCNINDQPDHLFECQPDKFQDKLIKENHIECCYPKRIKLMRSYTKMRCCNIRRILCCHQLNKILYSEKYAHHLLLSITNSELEK